ncbi:nicotinate-nucleotide adenylyltransferase [Azospirillum halopraeferens]|uniref:nicotinate-nucleotide adenylyltransferase n=1 Tax=Azospirillum halopraeferens TaxID=34010 RepID=UPI000688F8B3|nr:nicotinate-nucleotide adenylyltransferase [Azospirillum halopraeferens]
MGRPGPEAAPRHRPVNRWSGPRHAGLRIGLLGGSFNPAHAGHRHISVYALKALRLDRVWWLVSPQNPLKPADGMAPAAQRLAEASTAARHPRIVPTLLEGELGTRYTADTLAALTRRFPRTRFVWLMGADNLRQIPRWQRWTKIFRMVPIAVFSRPTYSLGALGGMAARRYARRRVSEHRVRELAALAPPAWAFLRNPLHPASATAIRRARARGSEPR